MRPGKILMLGLVLALALVGVASEAEGNRLGDEVIPTFQAIDLTLDAERTDYRGAVRIELRVEAETDRFRFHCEGPELRRVVLRGAEGEVAIEHEAETDEIVAVRSRSPLAAGSYTLEIEFTNAFDTQKRSLYRTESDGVGYAFTQFEPDDAREAFPCWDEPRFRHPFQMTLRVPEHHLAVTNTPVIGETVADGWRTVVFQKTRSLPSYLLAIATGPLETVPMPGLGVPGRVVTVRGRSHLAGMALAATSPILRALEEYFGSRYPFAKLDFIASPEAGGGMENAGGVVFGERSLLLTPETASVAQRRGQATLIAHELAHMWFGDLVTIEWWDDLWLNESFADWMGWKIAHQIFPELAVAESAVQDSHSIMIQDARSTTTAVRKPIESPKYLEGLWLSYVKGRTVLGMFEQWLGPERFRQGVIDYLDAHAWGNATAADLWRSLDEASGEKVSAAMATFIEQPGFPRIEVEILSQARVRLRQERFRNHGTTSPELTWRVPVTLKYPSADGVMTRTVLLASKSQTVSLENPDASPGAPAWIYPNASANGYYRWSVPDDQLRTLAEQAPAVLTPPERIELVGNVSALLAAGTLDGDEYLRVLSDFADDPDPLVVDAVIGALGSVKMAFVPAELEEEFARYVRQTLTPALERFGLERAPGEPEAVSLLRPTLVRWLGNQGRDQRIVRHAQTLARSYMDDASSVDPSLIDVALNLAASVGDRKLYEEYKKRFESAQVPPLDRRRYLSALGAFTSPELREATLRYALEGTLRSGELLTLIASVGADAAGWDARYQWMTENFEHLLKRIPPGAIPFLTGFASGCSLERLESAKVFFAEPGHRAPGTQNELEDVAEQVTDCVGLRERESDAVARYLSATMPESR